ncbi:MAG: ABC transporter permease, partial [Oscillospiraceae bacterium]
MTKILKYLKPVEWISALICGAFVAFQVWLDLKLPDYMSEITMLIQTSGEINQILSVGGKMLLCAFGSLIAAFITGFIAAKIAAGFSKRLRSKIYNKVEAFSMEEINKFSTSSLITRSTNDITQVQMVIAMGLQVMIKAPIMAVWAILKISNKNWQWSLATGICVALVILLFGIIVIFAMPKFKVIQKLTDNLNRVTRENLQGVRVVRAYNAEEYQENKFKSANNELTDVHLFTTRLMAIMMPCMTLLMNGLSLSIYWIGAYLINSADMLQKISLFSDM